MWGMGLIISNAASGKVCPSLLGEDLGSLVFLLLQKQVAVSGCSQRGC